jgi:hypothetical protein
MVTLGHRLELAPQALVAHFGRALGLENQQLVVALLEVGSHGRCLLGVAGRKGRDEDDDHSSQAGEGGGVCLRGARLRGL